MGTFFDGFPGEDFLFLDGAMGTELQKAGMPAGMLPELFGLEHPEITEKIHGDYLDAGSRILYANTFGANGKKLKSCGKSVQEIIAANIGSAKKAASHYSDPGKTGVALDVGPIGEMMAPLGTLSFEEAYEIFREIMTAGADAGADLIVTETFADLNEIRTAVLAAKENTCLPVFATMTFEERGRTFTGCLAESFAKTVSGLGVDAIGVNCSLGPKSLMPIIQRIGSVTDLPLIVKANAGLPDARDGHYNIDAHAFAEEMGECVQLGVRIVGGCCGTNPDYIRELKKTFSGKKPEGRNIVRETAVCSASRYVRSDTVRIIGERINPTGKKRFREALLNHDMDYVLSQGIEEADAGADILDVNVGAPGVNEPELMRDCVEGLISTTDLPLQIDSGNVQVLEAGLRLFPGKAIVNSVNGEEARLKSILPIVKKYGAAVVGLTMDEKGIPETAEERFAIAEKIRDACRSYGIPEEDILIDCLTLTVSASEKSAYTTLKTLRMVKEKLGLKTILGVSNISFGLPEREEVNRMFFSLAMEEGLDFAIINPNILSMTDAVVLFRLLRGEDPGCEAFIEKFRDRKKPEKTEKQEKQEKQEKTGETAKKEECDAAGGPSLLSAILSGQKHEAKRLAEGLLSRKSGLQVVDEDLIPALDEAGKKYEAGEIFLPQLLRAASASQGAVEVIKQSLSAEGKTQADKGTIILATVKGDIHDIGKNIVKTILENYGYRILDLGRDVPAEKITDTARKEHVKLIGLSALMTTTLPAMEETIEMLRKSGHSCKIMVGGAVLTPDYAKEIGADYYAKDAKRAADIAKEVFEN